MTIRIALPSSRVLKYAALALAAMFAIAGAVIAYLAATFDARKYEPRIVQFVKDKTGRTLTISGGVELSFWPDVGVRLSKLSLTERESTDIFASVEAARLRLEVLPLFSGQFFADEIVIRGAHVRIVRNTDGRLNIDDLLGREGEPVAFDIGRVAVEDSQLTFSDLASGARYELSHVALESGRLASGVATSFTLALDASDAPSTWKLAAALKSRLVFDLTQQRYAIEGAALELKGYVPGMTDLVARLTGDASFQAGASELQAARVAAVINARVGEELIEAKLDAPSVLAVPARALLENLAVSFRAEGPVGTTRANLMLPKVTRDADAFSSPAVTFELELKRGGTIVKANAASALEGNIAAPRLAFKDLKANFTADGPRLPGKHLDGALRGDAALDLEKFGVHVKLAGKVADSNVKADLTAAGFAAPVYTFVVDVDQIDLDRYAASAPAARRPGETAPDRATNPGQQLLAPLAELPASGTVHIGMLKAASVKARDVRLSLK